MYENQRKTHVMSCWLTKKPEKTAIGCGQPGNRQACAAQGPAGLCGVRWFEPRGADHDRAGREQHRDLGRRRDGAQEERPRVHRPDDELANEREAGRAPSGAGAKRCEEIARARSRLERSLTQYGPAQKRKLD